MRSAVTRFSAGLAQVLTQILINPLTYHSAALAALFFCLVRIFDNNTIIMVLTSLLGGSFFAIANAYGLLVWNAYLGIGRYGDVRQMTLSFVALWGAIGLSVLATIDVRINGGVGVPTSYVAGARYLALIAAILQVTAPDFGLGLFHGRDRRVLWVSVTLGATVAAVLIFAQYYAVLAP